ncbi:MAG: zf-HC2 domain-containing protein [Deltaproteobacteria bacterium]|nr:zf-HC2 domain-containing protein [Deltaproteobacteria bacterium]
MTARDDDKKEPRHVDCRKLVGLLGEYVDEQLPDEVRLAFDDHISQCAPCVAFLRQYRFAPAQARATLLQKVPADLESRLLSFLGDKCRDKKPGE